MQSLTEAMDQCNLADDKGIKTELTKGGNLVFFKLISILLL